MNRAPYYIGLDCGTSSVGWAVTDESYRPLKGTQRIRQNGKTKSKKQTLIGFRLFDEAETAAERRMHRSARRRNQRAKNRLKLLRMLFRNEIAKVDPEFFQRLRESFYYEEDKNLLNKSKNTLFNDTDLTDQEFHKLYPTIWHLRQAIIESDNSQSFDIRFYFLTIQHILKHRGHFLFDGQIGDSGSVKFSNIFAEFQDEAARIGYDIADSVSEIESTILSKTSRIDRKKHLRSILFIEGDDPDEDSPRGQTELAGLLVGSRVDLKKIFTTNDSDSYKFSFAEGSFEDKLPEIELAIGAENIDLIFATKKIYDYAILRDLLGEHKNISAAMVAHYKQHESDLKQLKQVFKPHRELYRQLFKAKIFNEKAPSYNAYIGKAYVEDKSGRRSSQNISQEDFNKYLHRLLVEIETKTSPELQPLLQDLIRRSETGEKSVKLLLPKQRGQAKGTILQQLHSDELKNILRHLEHDFPSFAAEVPDEDENYNTKTKKILKIHEFRIPYYCGPLVKRKFGDDGDQVVGGKSQFSWADEEIAELVYPWNFDRLVDKDSRVTNFIRRMTNECSYLIGEDVVPKCSLVYQKYMVLNELNNLKINGQRIDNVLKQKIFEQGYKKGELKGNITLKKFSKWCQDSGFIGRQDELSGISEVKTLPKYQTYQDFKRILGLDFAQQYSSKQLESIVEAITILGDEKAMLRRKIANILKFSESDQRVQSLAKLSYKDWGRMSAKFLNGIILNNHTILDYLWEDNKNLMELLGREIGFGKVIDQYNQAKRPASSVNVVYRDVEMLYCSPAVKRSIWQTLRIVDELVKNLKHAPKKIFLEVTRGDDENAKGKYQLTRKKELETKLKATRTDDARSILHQLEGYEDRDLQSKKLFLYFSQMGKCAYSGEPINLEDLNSSQLYDIDHIYPRSKTKDDSISRNLVLVRAELNREKTNVYPIKDDIRGRMTHLWNAWYRAGLITKEKYERLVRSTPLTLDELSGFIARQLVETSQSVRAIRDLLQRAYPKTKIVMVKASQVSEFRRMMSGDKKDRNGNVYKTGRYEFIKIRDLNDLHHAKDAYLNIVVGNVMNETFTDAPYEWLRERNGQKYSIRPELLFRDSQKYTKEDGKETIYPEVKAWNFAESIEIISDTMRRNDVVWTRMNYVRSGEISKVSILGKGKSEGILQIKQDPRLSVEKYGGYNKIQGAYFSLIEIANSKGTIERQIVSVPEIHQSRPEQYIATKYKNAKVILPIIKYYSLIKLGGFPMHLSGKTNENISFYPAIQSNIYSDHIDILRKLQCIESAFKKNKLMKDKYEFNEQKDGVSQAKAQHVYNYLLTKLNLFTNMPMLGGRIADVEGTKNNFAMLDIKTQCKTIMELIKIMHCNAACGDLSNLLPSASSLGKGICSSKIQNYSSAYLINQSPAGLYQEVIDLKTVQPKANRGL